MDTSRRALMGAAALSLAGLAGCDTLDNIFNTPKAKLPGTREPVFGDGGLDAGNGPARVVLPPVVANAAWPQAGGNPTHALGHLQAGGTLAQAWSTNLGEGGGYRAKILAQPVVDGGRIVTMDSVAVVSSFDVRSGAVAWTRKTLREDDDSTNIGGGLAISEGRVYAANGLGLVTALDARTGAPIWTQDLKVSTRSAPTVAAGLLYLTTIDGRLFGLSLKDGAPVWSYQALQTATGVLGQPAPAYADGFVFAGFNSGELVAVRAETGSIVWTDNLGATGGKVALTDLSAIHGAPVVSGGRVYATGIGNLTVCIDARSGRRLWEKTVGGANAPWLAGGWLFLLTNGQQATALSAEDGRAAWVTDLPAYGDPDKKKDAITWQGPLLVSDRLIFAGTQPEALSVSPYTGEVLGRQPLPAAAALAPTVAAGTVFFVIDDGTLIALR